MKNVYEECPKFENERWLLRLVEKSNVDDLLKVYGDKNALPFFNSDNCDGDNFYYHTKELMDNVQQQRKLLVLKKLIRCLQQKMELHSTDTGFLKNK